MSGTARTWFERALGSILVLTGLLFVAPVALFYWAYAQHTYTIGLSVNLLPNLIWFVAAGGLVTIIAGFALMRRS